MCSRSNNMQPFEVDDTKSTIQRKKTERHLRKEEERKMRHQAKHQERRGSNKGGGGGGGNSSKASPSRRSSRSGRASKDSSDGGSYRGPEVGMWVEAVRAEQQKGGVRSSSSNSSAAVYLSPFPHPSLIITLPSASPLTGALCGGGQGARGDDREKVRATLEWRSSGLPLATPRSHPPPPHTPLSCAGSPSQIS